MSPPLTPQPNCLQESVATSESTSTQIFGVIYITLTGLIDSMVPTSRLWAILWKSLSYIACGLSACKFSGTYYRMDPRKESINTRVQKLIRKYTKVIATKTVNGITTKRVSFVYNHVYHYDGVLAPIMEKVKPVLDTMYKPYMSDKKGENDNKEP
ncbi:hypothetical protein DSO57_1002479 [Entomophthora muscae]|uniref:Uncharacterized protein n=1 Tax=Entomophthora muscae TaxID=34485 RepID=A0ACC2TWH0_9FUNG|nr:hypothetical protein DSO57_1002479 [Entomophthora muscae]